MNEFFNSSHVFKSNQHVVQQVFKSLIRLACSEEVTDTE